jgi:hypothetical protein
MVYAPALLPAEMAALPGVERADLSTYVGMNYVDASGATGQGINGLSIEPAAIDPTFEVLRGRKPKPDEATAVMVNEGFVHQFHVTVGDDVRVRMYAQRDQELAASGNYTPHGPQFTFHVVGVVRSPEDIALDVVRSPRASTYNGRTNAMLVPDRFYLAHRASFLDFGASYDVQLDSPAHRNEFVAALRAAAQRRHQDVPPSLAPPRNSERHASFRTPVSFETTTLAVLAAIVALGGILVVVLLLRAEQRPHDGETPALRALGCSSRDLRAVAVRRTLPLGALAAVVAAVTTVSLSPFFPIGLGGELEPSPGVHVDGVVLLVAIVVAACLVMLPAVAAAGRGVATTRVYTPDRPLLADRLARGGAPVEVVVGTHFAFERRRAPLRRAAIAGGVILVLVLATGMFVAGIDDLYDEPAAHGWPWDAVIGNVNFPLPGSVATQMARDHRVTEQTVAAYGDVTLNGQPTELLAFDGHGTAPPRVLRGRLPRGANEIALGAKLLDQLGAHLGGRVRLDLTDGEFDDGSTHERTLDVVGVALAPSLGETELGKASIAPFDVVRAGGGSTQPQLILAKLRGPDPRVTARAIARATTAEIATDTIPSRVVNIDRVRRLPLFGALLAAGLGLVLLAYTFAVSTASRRRDLSMLRALGMTRRRLRRTLSWQGFVLALVIVAIGVPVGLLVGAASWRAFADQLGVGTGAHVPVWSVVAGPAAAAAAVLASVIPAHHALRSSISASLRVE